MSFAEWLYGSGGVRGNYTWGTNHIVSMVVIFALTILLIAIASNKKIDNGVKKKIVVGIAIFQLVFEILWRIIFLTRGDRVLALWPYYVCNLNGILIPIAVLTDNKTMKEMFYILGFIGGIITFAMPQGIFVNKFYTFPILKSMLQHTGLIFIPVFEYVSGLFRPKLKYIWLQYVGAIIHIINSLAISSLFGYYKDYLFFNLIKVPGVPGWLIIFTIGILGIAISYTLLNAPDVIAWFKEKHSANRQLQPEVIRVKQENEQKHD